MTITDRDKRALQILAGALVLAAIIWLVTAPKGSSSSKAVVAQVETVDQAEKRLARLRQIAATAPAKQQALADLTAAAGKREKGLLQGETIGQAQSQVLDVVRRIAKNASPPVDIRQAELGIPQPLGDNYGMVLVSVSFECRIEQLVDLLADLSAAPELVATEQLRIGAANSKQKTMPVRLTIAGVVPRRLLPARKGPGLSSGVSL